MSKNCFVIMPFSETDPARTETYWTRHFEDFLKPLIASVDPLVAIRSEARRADVLGDIITHLITDEVVVADLTDKNPNVCWELGVRQSFRHGTVTIAEYGTKLPFDISSKGTLFYHPKDHIKNKEFEKKFLEALNDCLDNPQRPDSHVLASISGRGSLFEILRKDECIRRLEALISELSRNIETFEDVWKTAEANTAGGKSFTTAKLCTSCVDLLISQRYVDADKIFYRSAETYARLLLATNGQLQAWETSPTVTSKWFLEDKDRATRLTKKMQEYAEKELARLRSIPGH